MKCQKDGCNNEAQYTLTTQIKPDGESLFDVEIYLCGAHFLNCFEIDIFNEAKTEEQVLNSAVLAPTALN